MGSVTKIEIDRDQEHSERSPRAQPAFINSAACAVSKTTYHDTVFLSMLLSQMLVYQNESNVYTKYNNTGCLKKRNLFDHEYLQDG